MLNVIIVLVVIAVGAWIWLTRKDEILQLLGKREDRPSVLGSQEEGRPSPKLVGHQRTTTRSTGTLEESAKKLSPLDVPMIQARFEKLGVLEHLNEHQSDVLRHTILEHCQESREELWWVPLVDFARYLDYQKGEMPAMIMDSSKLLAVDVRKYLFALDYRLRRSGIMLEDITGPKGQELEPDHVLTDGTYKVLYKVRDRAFRFPITVEDTKLDIRALIVTVNGLCQRKRAKGRFLLLPPAGDTWCVVYAVFTTAEQVTRSNWAQMPLPTVQSDEDVERVSENLHSAVSVADKGDKKPFELVPNVEKYGAEDETTEDTPDSEA